MPFDEILITVEKEDLTQAKMMGLPRELESQSKLDGLPTELEYSSKLDGLPAEIELCETNASAETKSEGLAEEEKEIIKEETDWSDEIIDKINNLKQYEILKNAGLVEVEIDGRKCLIKENIDLDYTDEDDVSNRDRLARGLAPLDSKTAKPIELHHLGQKANSPLAELTEEEHRTGEYKDGKKNQSLWHDNRIETEVHGEGNLWDQERKAHWKMRAENNKG